VELEVSEEFCKWVVGASLGFECFLSTDNIGNKGGDNLIEEKKDVGDGGDNDDDDEDKDVKIVRLEKENKELRAYVEILKSELVTSNGGTLPKTVSKLVEARDVDGMLNNNNV